MRTLLQPIAWSLGALLRVRHALYNSGLFKSTHPTVPTIAIGNLALGGTGKTPMLELVLRVLEGVRPIATLSRGYGRKSADIHEVQATDSAAHSGDEPVQVKRNFPAARVFVGADRVKAVALIQQQVPGVRAVVLDDALQHRALDAGLKILLTTAQRPYCDDALLPAGTLRDVPSRARVAQVVVVTKCVDVPTGAEQQQWRQRLGLHEEQHLFFAGMAYGEPRWMDGTEVPAFPAQETSALVFTGIVQPKPFVMHVRSLCSHVEHIAFADHHDFTTPELQRLADVFGSFAAGPKMLITTEKDAARLRSVIAGSPLEGLPLATIGVRTVILNEPEHFADLIIRHVGPHQAHR